MRAAILSSGSKGNVTYIEANNKKFLFDVGKNYKYIEEKLKEIKVDIKDIDYIVISHDHTDHISALKSIVSKIKATVLVSEKIFMNLDLQDYEHVIILEDVWEQDGVKITSFRSSHDAIDSRNFIIEENNKKICYVTDTGYINNKNFKYLENCDLYLFESNHDVELLQHGPYPAWLKKRVLSDSGHLSNNSAAFYLTKLIGKNTKKIVLIHLSEVNNMEDIALETIHNTFLEYGIDFDDVICARQDERTDVIEV